MNALKENSVADAVLRPKVHPLIHERTKRFLHQDKLLLSLVDGLGSPLNIIFPQNIDDNIRSFQEAYKKNNVKGMVYYTTKPCKSQALLRAASLHSIGLDVSSAASLRSALGCGFSADRLEATGPKNFEYILTALQLDVLLNVDNFEELKTILALRRKLGLTRKARVQIRLCGFSSQRISFTPHDNTFGIHLQDIPAILEWLVANKNAINFTGFSFHFGTTNLEQRLVAIENQLEMTFLAFKLGLSPKTINIGGGFDFNYTDDAEQWDQYIDSLKRSVLGEIPSQTWNNSGLGFRDYDGVVSGAPIFNPHYHSNTKGDELDMILNMRLPQFHNSKIASMITDSLLELSIEPGKSMVDQCGMTAASVIHSKISTNGETLTNLSINQTNLNVQQVKILTESQVIYRNKTACKPNQNGLYYTGNLCTSYDILQYNKQYPDFIPNPGDVICFMNTAPYAMDFNESETLMQPTAQKVAVWEDADGWHWSLDEKYLPLNLKNLDI